MTEKKELRELEKDIQEYEESNYDGITREGYVKGKFTKNIYNRGIFITDKKRVDKLKKALAQAREEGEFTKTEREHIRHVLQSEIDDGSRTGNRGEYWAMRKRVLKKLKQEGD